MGAGLEHLSSKSNIVPAGDTVSPNRIMMGTTADEQAVVLIDPDFNNLSSSFIQDIMRCTTDVSAERDYKVLKVVRKNDKIFTHFLFNEKEKILHVVQSRIYETTAEQHLGYPLKNIEKEEGEIIKAGEKMIKSASYSETGLAMHGRNLVAMSVTSRATTEDPIKLDYETAKEFLSPEYEKLTLQIDERNMLMKNIYGDNNNYKPLPDIGEHIKNGILCAIKKNAKFIASNDSLKRISLSDEIYRREGEILDIEVRFPIKYDNMGNIEPLNNSFLNDKRNELIEYELAVLDVMKDLEYSHAGYETTNEYRKLFSQLKAIYDEGKVFSIGSVNVNKLIINIHIKHVSELQIGQKLTGKE